MAKSSRGLLAARMALRASPKPKPGKSNHVDVKGYVTGKGGYRKPHSRRLPRRNLAAAQQRTVQGIEFRDPPQGWNINRGIAEFARGFWQDHPEIQIISSMVGMGARFPGGAGRIPRSPIYQTGEQIPSAASGHLPAILNASDAAKRTFTNSRTFNGHDPILDAALGGRSRSGGKNLGVYQRADGQVETNPMYPYRSRVRTNEAGELSPRDLNRLQAAGAAKAALDVQDATPAHWLHRGADNVGVRTTLDPAKIKEIAKTGVGVAHTDPKRGTLMPFDKASPEDLAAKYGGKPTRFGSDYIDFNKEWAKTPGSGAVVKKLLGYVDQAPGMSRALSAPKIRAHYSRRPDLDAATAKQFSTPARQDIANMHRIFGRPGRKGGIEGLREALNKGVPLPAVVGATSAAVAASQGVSAPKAQAKPRR